MISMQNVQVNYPTFELNCTLEVKTGMITGLIGENGAGKTTIFKALLGIIPIKSGEILIDNVPVNKLTNKKREKIGTVLSDAFFNGLFTIKDIHQLLKKSYSTYDSTYFLSQCQNFRLPDNQAIKEFSTGMLAKLKILTALSHQSDLLILDEPTNGLDVSARHEIIVILQEYMEQHPECSILISSHISSDLEKICDDIYYIKQGKILLHEDTDVLLNTYGIVKVDVDIFETISQDYIVYQKKMFYGYDLLTNQRLFYQENYPQLVIEKPGLDQILLMIMEGEQR